MVHPEPSELQVRYVSRRVPLVRRAHIIAIAALAAAVPAAAVAADAADAKVPRYQFRFEGRGFGHGVGMSQYGAQGAAKAGLSGEAIIGMYFPSTVLSRLPTTIVRVMLVDNAPGVELTSSGGWSVVTAQEQTATLPAGPLTVANVDSTTILKDAAGAEVHRSVGPVVITPSANALLAVNGRRYRGTFRLNPARGRVSVINNVDLEQYLPGVVPVEMPASWAPQALRAQAIAARSYAMATRRVTGDFDMYADERSQVYRGLAAEDARTTAAVTSTAGLVAMYRGRVATTFFSSTSGGRTEHVENVFIGSTPVPYLVSVDDARYDAISPRHVWTGTDVPTFTDSQLARRLGVRRPVRAVRIIARGASGRAVKVRIVTRAGAVKIMSGPQVRTALGLRSSWFEVRRQIRR